MAVGVMGAAGPLLGCWDNPNPNPNPKGRPLLGCWDNPNPKGRPLLGCWDWDQQDRAGITSQAMAPRGCRSEPEANGANQQLVQTRWRWSGYSIVMPRGVEEEVVRLSVHSCPPSYRALLSWCRPAGGRQAEAATSCPAAPKVALPSAPPARDLAILNESINQLIKT